MSNFSFSHVSDNKVYLYLLFILLYIHYLNFSMTKWTFIKK